MLAALVLPACSTGPVDATFNYELVDMEDMIVPWVGCQIDQLTGQPLNPNCQVSDPVIFRLDARVRDTDTQTPGNNIRVWFTSTYGDIYLLPQEVLEAINVIMSLSAMTIAFISMTQNPVDLLNLMPLYAINFFSVSAPIFQSIYETYIV